MNPYSAPLAWASGSARINRSCGRGAPAEKWWKSCTDLVSGSGGWGRTGPSRKVSDLKWQIQNRTEIMWLLGQSLSAWTTASARVILRTFPSTFSHSGFIILSPSFLHKGAEWFEWDRLTVVSARLQRDEFKERLELIQFSALFQLSFNTCDHSVQLNYWNRACVEIACCLELFYIIFFPIFWTLLLIHNKKAKRALDKLLSDCYDILGFCDSQTKIWVSHFLNSGFWDFVLQFDMKERMPRLLFE